MNLDYILKDKLEKSPQFQRECCRDVNNLKYAFDLNNDKDKCVLKCKHCGAVHHRMYAESGKIGLKL